MAEDHLICPGCRIRTPQALELRTLDRAGDVLHCACGRRYPIVDGVPIVMADPSAYLRAEMATVVERELTPEVAALLVEGGPDDLPYARLLEHLSIYLDAHWGDHATPPPDGPGDPFGGRELVDRIAERRTSRVALAVELGCSVGRILAELATGADHVVGVDLQFGAVRRARRILDGERVAYARRTTGRHYTAAAIHAPERRVAEDRRTLLCGDALDPPLVPGIFGRVVALNLLDSVRQPRQLLSVLDGLCAVGGEVILTSPYSWQSSVMDEDQRLGGDDPAGAITSIFREGTGLRARYDIEVDDELSWTLRRDARSAVIYRTHYLRARKLPGNVSPASSV